MPLKPLRFLQENEPKTNNALTCTFISTQRNEFNCAKWNKNGTLENIPSCVSHLLCYYISLEIVGTITATEIKTREEKPDYEGLCWGITSCQIPPSNWVTCKLALVPLVLPALLLIHCSSASRVQSFIISEQYGLLHRPPSQLAFQSSNLETILQVDVCT